jgi:hypothetical protein
MPIVQPESHVYAEAFAWKDDGGTEVSVSYAWYWSWCPYAYTWVTGPTFSSCVTGSISAWGGNEGVEWGF